jgi:hypothetical protein
MLQWEHDRRVTSRRRTTGIARSSPVHAGSPPFTSCRAVRGAHRTDCKGALVKDFLRALEAQRWDDHRYYHHSRINQSLHLFSALSFVVAYGLLFVDPVAAALIAWCLAMTSRQAGHFFFEPRGYDAANRVTDEYKERVKVGYNIRRKIVLMGLWLGSLLLVPLDPTLFGLLSPAQGSEEIVRRLGLLWLALGAAGLLFRTVHLFFLKDVQTGLVWMTKILTDPFHDIKLYHRAPLHLLRGELVDPSIGRQHG